MAFTPYDQVELSRYTPLSFEEITRPAMMQRERHDQVEAALADNATEVEKIGAILDANPADTALRERYNAYKQRLQAETDALLERGVNPVSIKNMHALRADFQTQVAPVGLAAQLRLKDREMYNQMLAKDPSLEAIDPGTRTLQHYLDNGLQSEPLQALSGRDIYRQVGEMVQGLSRADRATLGSISSNPEFRRILPDLLKIDGNDMLVNQYFQQHRDLGFSPADIENFRKTLSNPILRGVLEQAFAANGIGMDGSNTRGLAPDQVRRLLDWGISGLYGAIGKEEQQIISNKRYDDLAAIEKMERQARATGNGDDPPGGLPDKWNRVPLGAAYDSVPFGKLKEDTKKLKKEVDNRIGTVANTLEHLGSDVSSRFKKIIDDETRFIENEVSEDYTGGKPIPDTDKEFINGLARTIAVSDVIKSPLKILQIAGVDVKEMNDEKATGLINVIMENPNHSQYKNVSGVMSVLTREIATRDGNKQRVSVMDIPLGQEIGSPFARDRGEGWFVESLVNPVVRDLFNPGRLNEEDLSTVTGLLDNPDDQAVREKYMASSGAYANMIGNDHDLMFDDEGRPVPVGESARTLLNNYVNKRFDTSHDSEVLAHDKEGLAEIARQMRILPGAGGKSVFRKLTGNGLAGDLVDDDDASEFFGEDASIGVYYRPHVGFVFSSDKAKGKYLVLNDLSQIDKNLNNMYTYYSDLLGKLDNPFYERNSEARNKVLDEIKLLFNMGTMKNLHERKTKSQAESMHLYR